jgi:hypothetical protein
MKIEIKSWITGDVLFEGDFSCLADAVKSAVKSRANLSGVKLTGANLYGANLYGANLTGANLYGANLYGANLYGANLYGANLSGANLTRANLSGANLTGANLYGVKLTEADLKKLYAVRTILPEGDIIGYKKLKDGTVCKLLIPANAKRVGGMVGRKCRAEYAEILEGEGVSSHDGKTAYKVGETIRPAEKFDPNPMQECTSGIHFFITRQEAENY